jgi:hypothetical protein
VGLDVSWGDSSAGESSTAGHRNDGGAAPFLFCALAGGPTLESFRILFRMPTFAGGAVERPGRLNSQQLKDLSDELAALTKQQSDARLLEVFVRMSEAEIKAFDLRTQRISRIHVLLSEHDSRR